jgi:hypothetical protein
MNIEINIFTVLKKDLKREETAHLAALKSIKEYKLIASLRHCRD